MEDTYKKSKGNAGLEGVQFQLDLLTVSLLNALRIHKDWKISSENQEAGKYDDLVLELPDESVLLQAKFKQSKKITRDQLFSSNPKNADFSLPKYFFSYFDVKGQFKDKTVIICTNTDLEAKGLENVLSSHRISFGNTLHYEGATCRYFTFNKNILPDLKTNAHIYLDKNLQGKSIDKEIITDENIEDFLKNLQFFTNYPSGEDLHKIVEQLLSQLNNSNLYCRTSYHEIYRKVEDWFKQPKGEYLTEIRARAMFSEIRSDKYCESLKYYDISFECNDFIFTDSNRIYLVNTNEGHLLQMLKIFHALQVDKGRKLYINPNDSVEIQQQVLEAFEMRDYVYLIMICTKTTDKTLIQAISGKLKQILEKAQYKKIIFLVEDNEKLIKQIGLRDISQVDGTITLKDLSKDSQEKLLKFKSIVFQGNTICLEDLLVSWTSDGYGKSLHSGMLEVLIRGEQVKVGVPPSDLDEEIDRYYIRRAFKREAAALRKRRNVIREEEIYDANEKMIIITDSAGMGKSTVLTKLALVVKKKWPHLWIIRVNLNDYTVVLRDFLRNSRKMISVVELLNSQETTKLTNHFEELVFSMTGKVVLMLDAVDEISPDYTGLILNLLTQCQEAPNFAKIFVTTRPHVTKELKEIFQVKPFKMLPLTRRNQVDFLTSYWKYNLQFVDALEDKCKRYAETLVTKMSSWINSSHYREIPFAAMPLQVRMLAEIFIENIQCEETKDWEGCKEYLEANCVKPQLPDKINIARLYEMFIEKKRGVFIDKGNPIGNVAANQALIDQFEECLEYHRGLALKVILRETELDLFSQCHVGTEKSMLKIGIVQKLGDKFQFVHRTFAEYFLAECILRELKLKNTNVRFQMFLIDEILVKPKFKIVRGFLDRLLQKVVYSLPPNIFKTYQSFTCKTDWNNNPIFVLCKEGWVTILQLILKSINFKIIRGKEIGIRDWRVKIAMGKRNQLNNLKLLVGKAGINIKNEIGNTPLHCAMWARDLELVKFLIEQGAGVNIKNIDGSTPLHLGVMDNTLDTIEYLIRHGASVNIRNKKGRTCLHLAAGWGKLDIVQCLVNNGVNLNVRCKFGYTALHLAAERGKLDIVKNLVKMGANVNVKNKSGQTALDLAIERNELDTIRYLEDLGALHLAAKRSESDTVKYP